MTQIRSSIFNVDEDSVEIVFLVLRSSLSLSLPLRVSFNVKPFDRFPRTRSNWRREYWVLFLLCCTAKHPRTIAKQHTDDTDINAPNFPPVLFVSLHLFSDLTTLRTTGKDCDGEFHWFRQSADNWSVQRSSVLLVWRFDLAYWRIDLRSARNAGPYSRCSNYAQSEKSTTTNLSLFRDDCRLRIRLSDK